MNLNGDGHETLIWIWIYLFSSTRINCQRKNTFQGHKASYSASEIHLDFVRNTHMLPDYIEIFKIQFFIYFNAYIKGVKAFPVPEMLRQGIIPPCWKLPWLPFEPPRDAIYRKRKTWYTSFFQRWRYVESLLNLYCRVSDPHGSACFWPARIRIRLNLRIRIRAKR